MDKRWVGILLIFVIGIGCLYLIVDSSNTVGKAVTICDEMTITLPNGFDIADSGSNNVTLTNKNNESIFIEIMGLGNNSAKFIKEETDLLKQNGEIKIEKSIDNKTKHIIYYKNVTSEKKSIVSFFEKDNRTIKLEMDQYPGYEKDMNFIFDTIVHNFKQNKDME